MHYLPLLPADIDDLLVAVVEEQSQGVVDVGVVVYTGQIGQPDEVTVLLSEKYIYALLFNMLRLWLMFFGFPCRCSC
jgi:hypothetical protein